MGNDGYTHFITLNNYHKSHGYVSGQIDGLNWYAYVSHKTMPIALNCVRLARGAGHVIKLSLFSDSPKLSGNPYSPKRTYSRQTLADYDCGWRTFDQRYRGHIADLVNYIERRSILRVVK